MAIPAATPHVAGTNMVWADLAANFAAYRGWLNAIPTADLQNASIQREHLIRPVINADRFEGENSAVYFQTYGLDEVPANGPKQWGPRADRLLVPLPSLGAGGVWRFPVGASFYLPYEALAEVTFSLEWQVRTLTPGEGGPSYPDGAGAGNRLGYFTVGTFFRSTGGESLIPQAKLWAYPMDTAAGRVGFHDSGRCSCLATLGAGAWDVFLAFVRDGAGVTAGQIDVSRITGKIEAHM